MRDFFRIIAVSILVCLWSLLPSLAEDFDPNSPDFDPDKKFSITPYGGILGDPAQAKVVSNNDRVGFSVVTVNPGPDGLLIMASIIEPQQDGKPGGGYAMMMSLGEKDKFIELLEKAPSSDVASLADYGQHHKLVGRVTPPDAPMGEIAIVFKADDLDKSHIRIVLIMGGTPSIFEFTPNAVQKLVKQLNHYVDDALAKAEATKL